jgi:hypothetical protein
VLAFRPAYNTSAASGVVLDQATPDKNRPGPSGLPLPDDTQHVAELKVLVPGELPGLHDGAVHAREGGRGAEVEIEHRPDPGRTPASWSSSTDRWWNRRAASPARRWWRRGWRPWGRRARWGPFLRTPVTAGAR